MKNRKQENLVLALIVLVVMGIFAFAIHVRPTADQVAMVKATDISCGVTLDIEKNLYEKLGVVTVDVNSNLGEVTVGYDSKIIQPNVIASAIAKMGCEVTDVAVFDIDRFKAMTGKRPGTNPASVGCGGACGVRK